MEKKFCAYIFAITFIALSSIVHGQTNNVQRSPSVEPTTEVDIQDAKKAGTQDVGYDFVADEIDTGKNKSRVPANIITKAEAKTPASYIGPMIFLIALPFGLWIMVSKKISKASEERKVGYYPKTQQFKPYTNDYQKPEEDDDDVDFPKAS